MLKALSSTGIVRVLVRKQNHREKSFAVMNTITPGLIDYLVLAVYIVCVLGVGFVLKRFIRTSSDIFSVRPLAFPPGWRGWRSCPPTWARRRSSAWPPPAPSTAC